MEKIILAISGSIAAYKGADLASKLSKKYDTHVIMTKNAKEFISPLTFYSLTNNPVLDNEYDMKNGISHINVRNNTNIMVIAPATANIIAKIANGIADDILTSTVLAFKGKIFIAPAMNTNMYLNHITQENIEKLKKLDNFHFIEPSYGTLACKEVGIGKLADINKIYDIVDLEIEKIKFDVNLKNKKVLIITGPTTEKLDNVRVLTNISSGKMGISLSKAFLKANSNVTVLSTQKIEKEYLYDNVIIKKSTNDIYDYIKRNYEKYDIIISVAAISDIKAKLIPNRKLKKYELLDENNRLKIEFEKNPDILEFLGQNKLPNQLIIGFSAESDNIFENTKNKLIKKNIDYIILNDISRTDIGFNSNENEVYILEKNKDNMIKLDKDEKEKIAERIVETIFKNT